MAGLMQQKITGCAFATQLLQYEKLSPGNVLKESQQRALGHRTTISKAFISWAVFNITVGFIVSVVVVKFGQLIVPLAMGSLWALMLNVGLVTAVVVGDLTRAKADFLAVKSSIASRAFIQAAHNRNKTVSAWTVNEEYAMSAIISRGMDNLITDYPDVARRVLAERQEMSPLERLMVELAFYLGVNPPAGGTQ